MIRSASRCYFDTDGRVMTPKQSPLVVDEEVASSNSWSITGPRQRS